MKRESAYRHKNKFDPKILFKCILGILVLAFIFVIYNQIIHSKFLGNDWRTNIVFNSAPVLLISFPKTNADDASVFLLPENLSVQVPNGYGNYQINKIWKLADMEKKPNIYASSFANLFDTYISSQIGKDQPLIIKPDTSSAVSILRREYNLFGLMFSTQLTNLSFFDKFVFWLKLNQLKTDNTQFYDLNTSDLVNDFIQPDGQTVKNIDINSWNTFLSDKFIDNQIRSDKISIEVRNATNVPGIGQKFTQMLNNLGARVISTSNTLVKQDNCQLITRESLQSVKITKLLQKEFNCQVIITEDAQGIDLLVILGKYYGEYYDVSPD